MREAKIRLYTFCELSDYHKKYNIPFILGKRMTDAEVEKVMQSEDVINGIQSNGYEFTEDGELFHKENEIV